MKKYAFIALLLCATGALAAAANYKQVMQYVFLHEGGWFNHPNDPGGATMYGITIHDVRRYINPRATAADVRRLTRDQAAEIYRVRYWNVLRGDELGPGLDYAVMDLGVNSGVGRARSFTRRALGLNGTMTAFTDAEIKLIRERCEPDACLALIRNINGQRLRFVRSLGIYRHFGRGWERRIAHVSRESQRMTGRASAADMGRYIVPRYGGGVGRAVEEPSDLEAE